MSTAHDQAIRAYNRVSFLTYNEEASRTRHPKAEAENSIPYSPWLSTVTHRYDAERRYFKALIEIFGDGSIWSGNLPSSILNYTLGWFDGNPEHEPRRASGYDSGYEDE